MHRGVWLIHGNRCLKASSDWRPGLFYTRNCGVPINTNCLWLLNILTTRDGFKNQRCEKFLQIPRRATAQITMGVMATSAAGQRLFSRGRQGSQAGGAWPDYHHQQSSSSEWDRFQNVLTDGNQLWMIGIWNMICFYYFSKNCMRLIHGHRVFGLLVPLTIGSSPLVPLPWMIGTMCLDDWSHGLLVQCTYHVPCTILTYWWALHSANFHFNLPGSFWVTLVDCRVHLHVCWPCQTSTDTHTNTPEHGHVVKKTNEHSVTKLKNIKDKHVFSQHGKFG